MRPILVLCCATALLVLTTTAPLSAAEKLKPEEVIAKHLESIGTEQARAAAGSRVMRGPAVVTFRRAGSGQLSGDFYLASDSGRSLFQLVFNNSEYPHEKYLFDGDGVEVANLKPGVRSPLSTFMHTHQVLGRDGLLSGVLSARWPLLQADQRGAKLQYGGLKKVDNRQLHELRYRSKKSSDLQISLFFEDGTFRHVRSVYKLTLSAPMGARPADSPSQSETRYQLTEDFSEFKEEGGLTLPHAYRLEYLLEGAAGTLLHEWVMSPAQFRLDQPVDPATFKITGD